MTLGERLFKYRGELAIPFAIAAIAFSQAIGRTFLAGILVTAIGEAIRLSALRHIGPKSRRTQRTGGSRVVRSGPYGWTRNPLYLGNFFMVAGLLVALNRWWLLALGVPLVIGYYRLIIGAEEGALEKEFGDEYRTYLAEVPRFFPRPPAAPGEPAPFGVADVILPELNTIVSFELAFAAVGAVAMWRGM